MVHPVEEEGELLLDYSSRPGYQKGEIKDR